MKDKKTKELMKILSCDLDCDNCERKGQECIRDIRKCINVLIRLKAGEIKKRNLNKKDAEGMVS